jgi:hypothetical protein
MIRKLLFFSLLIFTATVQLNAQGKSSLADCRKIIVQDPDRRLFDARNSFAIDVDGDGKPDTITPRTYTVKVNRRTSSKTKSKVRENYWITFDIKTSRGRVLKSFFKYNYGTNESVYWVYALVPCKINRDGRIDLLFYSGDDTTEETIILVNRGNVFKVYSRKVEELNS